MAVFSVEKQDFIFVSPHPQLHHLAYGIEIA